MMRPPREDEFENNVLHLIELLKKIIRQHPDAKQVSKAKSLFKDQGLNLNFCVFNFFPMTEDEISELEEICESYLSCEDGESPVAFGLNQFDQDFLHQNGIQF